MVLTHALEYIWWHPLTKVDASITLAYKVCIIGLVHIILLLLRLVSHQLGALPILNALAEGRRAIAVLLGVSSVVVGVALLDDALLLINLSKLLYLIGAHNAASKYALITSFLTAKYLSLVSLVHTDLLAAAVLTIRLV